MESGEQGGPGAGEGTFRGTQIRDDGTGPVLLEHRQKVVVVAGPDRGLEAEITGNSLAIGTAPTNDLVLADDTVSRRHCMISVQRDRYVVRDLESTNGTIVDGTPVLEAFLAPGARIRLGDTEILFQPKKKWERIEQQSGDRFGQLWGRSEAMKPVFALLAKLAPTDLSCILVGETGTGKELAARAIHDASRRAAKPFVVVDCGAISDNLIESELFGHERGAFTGADRQRIGAFEAAHGGTVFLDEIGELPIDLQPKLLRVLERREIKRLGSTRLLEVDVRVVAATHRDLPGMVRQGQFREDLYYRLAEVVVSLPALRERRGDVGLLAQRILDEYAEPGARPPQLDGSAIEELERRNWPGNVRELRNVLRRSMMMTSGPMLRAADLRLGAGPGGTSSRPPPPSPVDLTGEEATSPSIDVADDLPIKDARERWVAPMEREYLIRVLKRCGGDLDRAAADAGVHRKSFERLLRQHGIKAGEVLDTEDE
ncbi:sigma-54 interaction domain-containing protein [Sandaracinus amylolyticus]|uniref:sigma-54 interaction domain-containing protein n=1 Tax=Sandaracinus amylolyticus TaxID=927083 RepID=UPI001F3B6554|nr:sigma 54-interacting transcriptional regulator [Sandaracinus amylolyticus]UJR78267.1 Two-component system nitrogen regulation response regulator GlnG [Sandaracinus amylolyticus]